MRWIFLGLLALAALLLWGPFWNLQSQRGLVPSKGSSQPKPADDTSIVSLKSDARQAIEVLSDSAPVQTPSPAITQEPETKGQLLGRILSPAGAPVAGVSVAWASSYLPPTQCTTDGAGKFAFSEVPVNLPLALSIEDGSLPAGCIAPSFFGVVVFNRHPYGGQFVQTLTLEEPGVHLLEDIDLENEAIVTGRFLRKADDSPVEGVPIHLEPWRLGDKGRLPSKQNLRTGPKGTFELSLRPGKYKCVFRLSHPTRDLDRQLSGLAPRSIELVGGQVYDFADLVLGGGAHSVQGRVLDQHGQPIPDLNVLGYFGAVLGEGEPANTHKCFLARARTDAQGVYQLEKVVPGPMAIQAGVGDYVTGGGDIDGKRLASAPEIAWVLVQGGDVRAPDVTARISEPFRILFEIQPRGPSPDLRDLSGHTVWIYVPIEGQPGERRLSKVLRLLAEGDSKEWACQTPHGEIEVHIRGPGGNQRIERVLPTPHGEHRIQLD